jgi:hypothetical protein
MQRLPDILAHDNAAIFNDFRDFTDLITISTNRTNERQVMGSLQSDKVTFNASVSDVLNAFAVTLYMPEQADLNLSKNQILYVNGRAFKITDSTVDMGVCVLSLEKK